MLATMSHGSDSSGSGDDHPERTVAVPPKSRTPPKMVFDAAWAAAYCDGDASQWPGPWKVEVDETGARAHVTQGGRRCLTLLRGAPLPRDAAGQRFPSYRVVVEAYSEHPPCFLGLVPGVHAATPVTPNAGDSIWAYGGWCIAVRPSSNGDVHDPAVGGWEVVPQDASAFATTAVVPPVPPGSAVEFAVDYAAAACHVTFFTPAAVEGGFAEAPYAKLELRFVTTPERSVFGSAVPVPARPLPTPAVDLYPAVQTGGSTGAIWRFV
jgi:hypothetical protein